MGRIPDGEIERLKQGISVEAIARSYGVELAGHGDNLIGRCPLHSPDRTPSFVVTPSKNLWHCLGACQKGGSVIDLVMAIERVSFREAYELLRGGAALTPRADANASSEPARRKLPPLAQESAGDAELLESVVAHYHATLKESPDALAYLRARGLEHPEMIDRFRLGFSNRTLGYRLPEGSTKAGSEMRGRLTEVGVLRSTGHEHLRGSLVIPLFDASGRVVQLYGRKIRNDLGEQVPKHLYLPGPHRGVFNREGLGESDEVILCEALIDALTFWCAGYRNVTTAYGIEGFTDEIAACFVELGIQVVKIAFDRDEAGDRGAEKVSAKLKALGIETQRVLFPKGMDANQYATKLAPAEKSLGIVLRQAAWMSRPAEGDAPEAMRTEQRTRGGALSTPPEPPTGSGGLDSAPPPRREEEALDARARTPELPSPAPFLAASSSSSSPPATSRSSSPVVEEDGDDRVYRFGASRWRVRVISKQTDLRVRVVVERAHGREGLFVDTVDLYAARSRMGFLKTASHALELDAGELGAELEQIYRDLEKQRAAKKREAEGPPPAPTMTEDEREEALALLRDPKLLDRVLDDLTRAGIVGEETNKLVGYVAATSRKLEEPLAVVIQSSSAAGKSSLMEAVLALMPEEERVQYSAMTGQSLYYMGSQNLRHRILAIVEEEGAERASYALKLLQSEGELTIAAAGKDPATGKLVTHDYKVAGPVMIFLTTTAIEVDEELLNRCIVLTVDEGPEQTRAIHERQREARTLEGIMARRRRQEIRKLHRNAQRLLQSVLVVNPFARDLGFTAHATRTRRDHAKYLTLIEAVTLLHQYQRPRKHFEESGRRVEYIEVTREDVAIATKLAKRVLGRSLDELPPQTRRLYEEISSLVEDRVKEGAPRETVRFSRRELRERTRWGNTQLKVHMKRLEELELVVVHRGRGPLVNYELAGAELGDVDELISGLGYDQGEPSTWGDRSGSEGDRSGVNGGSVGGRSGTGRAEVRPISVIESAIKSNGSSAAEGSVGANRDRILGLRKKTGT